jgi:serine/threonine protein phosphatase PrpC
MEIRDGIELANLSDVGCERDNNEDYFCYFEPDGEAAFLRKGRLAVVADGMGGEEGGEIASRLAVDAVRETYLARPEPDPQQCLIHAFQAAHEAILECVRQHPELQSMGTTCTAVAITDGHAHFAHIGDSRLYLIRGSSLLRLTHDHTAISKLIEQGVISPADADTHPQRHILTAALSARRDVSADFSPYPVSLQSGDVLVLCTDGLWAQITDDELLSIVRGSTATEACRELVRLAKARGGPDNITVQILRITAGERKDPGSQNGSY